MVAERRHQAFLYFRSFQHPTLDVDLNFIEGFHSQRKCPPCQFPMQVGREQEKEYGTPPGVYMVDCPLVILWAGGEHLSPMDR